MAWGIVRKGVAAGAAAIAVVATGVGVYAYTGSSDTAEVVRVIDGDTLDVEYQGETQRVRLLNVDTPETKHPDKAVECMGPEASEYLERKLPAGTEISLKFDQERFDKYDRLLAAVYLDDEFVNAKIAKLGLGVAVFYGANTKFYDEVAAAQQKAEKHNRGLFDDDLACSLDNVLDEQIEALQSATEPPLADSVSGVQDAMTQVSSATDAIDASIDMLSTAGSAGFGSEFFVLKQLHGNRLATLKDTLSDHKSDAVSWQKGAEKRISSIKAEEKKKKEAARKKKEEEKRKKEQQEQARQQAQREAATQPAPAQQSANPQPAPQQNNSPQRNTQPAPERQAPRNNGNSGSSQSGSSGNTGGSKSSNRSGGGGGGTPNLGPDSAPPGYYSDIPGYTGPRCYLPGGKFFKPC